MGFVHRLVESDVADEVVGGIVVLVELLEAGPLVDDFFGTLVLDPDLFEDDVESGTLGDEDRTVLGEKLIHDDGRDGASRNRSGRILLLQRGTVS